MKKGMEMEDEKVKTHTNDKKKRTSKKKSCTEGTERSVKDYLDILFREKSQESLNEYLASRIKERQDAKKILSEKSVAEALAKPTPEIVAGLTLEQLRMNRRGVPENDPSRTPEDMLIAAYNRMEGIRDTEVFRNYFKLYDDTNDMTNLLSRNYRSYKVYVGIFAYYTMILKKAEEKAKLLNDLLKSKAISREKAKEELQGMKDDGVEYLFNEETKLAEINIRQKDGLLSCMMDTARTMKETLSVIKAFIVGFDNYVKELEYELYISNSFEFEKKEIESEYFSLTLVGERFHESHISKKKEQGLPVTPDEEALALVPDYRKIVSDIESVTSSTETLKIIRNVPMSERNNRII